MANTALGIITQALLNLNVVQPGTTLPPAMAADGLKRLNLLMDTWAKQLAPAHVLTGVYLPLRAGQQRYTWGLAGCGTSGCDITQPRPQSLETVSLIVSPPGWNPVTQPGDPRVVAVPLAVLTDQMAQELRMPQLQSTQPTAVHYNDHDSVDLGHAWLDFWPVPNNSLYTAQVFYYSGMYLFPDLTTSIEFPYSYEEALIYNLERRLAGPYGREMPADDAFLARETFATLMRSQQKLFDVPNDFATALGRAGRHGYNIESGSGGGS